VEIKQEIKREGTGDAGAKEFRIEGREGNDTDSKSQGVSQPDQGMNVVDTWPVHSDLTGHIKMYNQGEPTPYTRKPHLDALSHAPHLSI
jgi:hypothetical protein